MAEGPAGSRPVVAVVGGGISGIVAARVLAASPAGVHVLLLEETGELGGRISSGEVAGVPVELGPDQFLRRDPSAERLCREVGLGDDLVEPSARSAGIFSYGRLRPIPRGTVVGVPTDLEAVAESGVVSPAGVERARLDSSLPGPDLTGAELGLEDDPGGQSPAERSAGDILRPRLGDEVVDRLVDPLLGGINAGGVDTLSLGVVTPQIASALSGRHDVLAPLATTLPPPVPGPVPAPGGGKPEQRSPFLVIRGGLARLVRACQRELEQGGVEILTRTPVTAVELVPGQPGSPPWRLETATRTVEAHGLVLALPGYVASEIVKGFAPGASAALGEVPYASVAMATLAFEREQLVLPSGWSGFLVPRNEERLMTAATFLTSKWPWMSQPGTALVRVSAGRYGDERIGELDDGELARLLAGELADLAGVVAKHKAWRVTRFDHSFPQYRPGHRSLVARARRELAELPSVELAGAVLGGIGIPACISSGQAAGGAVADSLLV